MTKTQKLGQLWTDAVAYVALVVGAGLSIAGNVANVSRTRGAALDSLDVVLAVAFPALVVLMVEVFVSSRWRGLPWPMQILRWAGTLAIGAVAMRVSWTHLHDLMINRRQTEDVATLGPLAIDALAIMATALILAGRGQARPVQPVDITLGQPHPVAKDAPEGWTDRMDALARREDNPVAMSEAALPAADEDTKDLSSVQGEVDKALDAAGRELASETEDWLANLSKRVPPVEPTPAVPVVPGGRTATRPSTERVGIADGELADLVAAAMDAGVLNVSQQNDLLAGWYGVSTRTIRRRRDVLGLNPTSGPPAA